MAAFDLASVLSAAGAQMGTGKEQIEYIRITKIKPDPDNFYELGGIEELCANIELIGLQQPLRVRADAENAGEYIIVSGHRRWTALYKLVNEGHDQYLDAPCIVEQPASSAELQELRLIYANADTRKMTNAELAKQAARVEELLYKLKEQGVDFPGRMRDHVAEACKVSKTKLQRLKQIQSGLAPDIAKEYYEKGELQEGAALALSKLPVGTQRYIIGKAVDKPGVGNLNEYAIEKRAALLQRFEDMNCPVDGGHCANCEGIFDKVYANGYEVYSHCSRENRCCHTCPELATCSKSCPVMAAKKASIKAEMKVAKAEEKERAAAKDAPKIALIRALWARMGEALDVNKLTYTQLVDKAQFYAGAAETLRELLISPLTAKVTADSILPFGYGISLTNINVLTSIADTLGCSIDYLLCHDTPVAPVSRWRDGNPPKQGTYIINYQDADMDGERTVDECEWTGERWKIGTYATDIRWIEEPED